MAVHIIFVSDSVDIQCKRNYTFCGGEVRRKRLHQNMIMFNNLIDINIILNMI